MVVFNYQIVVISVGVILEFLELVRPEIESLLIGRNEAVFRADELKTSVRLALCQTQHILSKLKEKAE